MLHRGTAFARGRSMPNSALTSPRHLEKEVVPSQELCRILMDNDVRSNGAVASSWASVITRDSL